MYMLIISLKGGYPPRDSEIIQIQYVGITSGLYYTMCALSGLGILYTAVSIGFNVRYRNTK